jgi:hypothetical protein
MEVHFPTFSNCCGQILQVLEFGYRTLSATIRPSVFQDMTTAGFHSLHILWEIQFLWNGMPASAPKL